MRPLFKVGDIVEFKQTRGFENLAGQLRKVIALEPGLMPSMRPMVQVCRLDGVGKPSVYYNYRFRLHSRK